MFGDNAIEKRIDGPGLELVVKEIFYTIQGEGPYAGRCAVFLRLAGCHLACTFCDTDFEDGKTMSVDEITATVISHDPFAKTKRQSIVVLTGGEPTRQPIDYLVTQLINAGYTVQIETAGSFWRDCMNDERCQVVVSPKTGFVHADVAAKAICFKYVIDHRYTFDDDGLPICNTQGRAMEKPLAKPPNGTPIYLSPMDAYNINHTTKNKAMVATLAMKHGYIAGLQLHKELGGLP